MNTRSTPGYYYYVRDGIMRKIIADDLGWNACMNDQVICTLMKKRNCFILSGTKRFHRIDKLPLSRARHQEFFEVGWALSGFSIE